MTGTHHPTPAPTASAATPATPALRAAFALALLAALAAGCAGAANRVNDALPPADAQADAPPAQRLLAQAEGQAGPAGGAAPPAARAADAYRLGPGDLLAVRIMNLERVGEVTRLELPVDAEGTVGLPLVGVLPVEGRTAADVRRLVAARLQEEEYLPDPQVQVWIAEMRSKRVHVLGAVRRPGAYAMEANRVTLPQAVALAGGPSDKAGTRLTVYRPARRAGRALRPATTLRFDIEDMARTADGALAPVIEPGDTVELGEAPEVFVHGYVRRPGALPLRRPKTVLEAVAQSGGLISREASPRKAFVLRPLGEGMTQVIRTDLVAMVRGHEPALVLAPGDYVQVPQTATRAVLWEIWSLLRGQAIRTRPGSF